jgi:FAD/FMN-containing dehydrogenase
VLTRPEDTDWYRSQAEIDAFRAIKRALDPAGILNPNVLLPPLPSAPVASPG